MFQSNTRIAIKSDSICLLTTIFVLFLMAIPLLGLRFISKDIPIYLSLLLSLSINLSAFFASPKILDANLRGQYNEIDFKESIYFQESYPITFSCIQRICASNHIEGLAFIILNDESPIAFTYGNFRNNARIAISEGLVTLLDDEEIASVIAHELGHIVHYDFAIMTLLQAIVSTFYILGHSLLRSNNSNSKTLVLKIIGLILYAFYFIGYLCSLYLSRIREYSADYFSSCNIDNPSSLSMALIKVTCNSSFTRKNNIFVRSISNLNILDPKGEQIVAQEKKNNSCDVPQKKQMPSFSWGKLLYTHPPLYDRIQALNDYSKQRGLRTIDSYEKTKESIYKTLADKLNHTRRNSKKNTKKNDFEIKKLDSEPVFKKIYMRHNRLILAIFGPALILAGIIVFSSDDLPLYEMLMSILTVILGVLILLGLVYTFKHNPGHLLLSSEGLEIVYASSNKNARKQFFRWTEIEEIRISYIHSSKQVCFNFSDEYLNPNNEFTKFFNRSLIGYDVTIGGCYEIKPEELCYTLQKWKNFYS